MLAMVSQACKSNIVTTSSYLNILTVEPQKGFIIEFSFGRY